MGLLTRALAKTCAVLLAAGSSASAAPCPTRPSWPTLEWPSRVEEVAAAREPQVTALEEYAFTLVGRDEERLGIRTDAVVIVHGGAIIFERYARGYDPSKPHIGWSVTKSVMNSLAGVAVGKGALSLEDSICTHFRAPKAACRISVRSLLEFTSGLDWKETYENESYQVSSVLAMLYGEGRRDMATFVASHPFRAELGARFSYSSGDSTLLAAVIDGAARPSLGEEWPWKELFEPVGMTSVVIERDPRGTMVGSSHFYATPRDYARFGFLFLNDGCWGNRRILPEGWVADSTSVTEPFRTGEVSSKQGDVQGRQWWLNRPVPEREWAPAWPGVPEDAYAAEGHWGQSVTVIPSLDLVVVRTADDRKKGFELDQLLRLAIEVAK
ncbi:MAG: serine hydrolase [Myxococcales bacterium]|nr:serine hydrolase [Myxococcales bacterium]